MQLWDVGSAAFPTVNDIKDVSMCYVLCNNALKDTASGRMGSLKKKKVPRVCLVSSVGKYFACLFIFIFVPGISRLSCLKTISELLIGAKT